NAFYALSLHDALPISGNNNLSGGEETKYRIVQTLSDYKIGLLLDEPTTHLDQQSIDFLIQELEYYYGTLIFVSHDRYFINSLARSEEHTSELQSRFDL